MSVEDLRIPAEQLTRVCNPDDLGFETTNDIAPLDSTIGQERAISALELSLDIEAPGFNLFISGLPGTGRNTALKTHLERISATKPTPHDWGYVYNFMEPGEPVAISLPCGMMRGLCRDMEGLINFARTQLPSVFESDDYQHRVEEVTEEIQNRRQQLTDELEQKAQQQGFTLSFTQVGVTPVPLKDGRQMTQEEYQAITDEEREALRERAEEIQHDVSHMMNEVRRMGKDVAERVKNVDAEIVRYALKPNIDEIQEKYSGHSGAVTFLDSVENDMVEHLEVFKPQPQQPQQTPFVPQQGSDEDFFKRYEVNDLVDNTSCEGAPIIFEYSPTYYNVFGRIEYRARLGALTTDHTMIKAGALLRANGGYLVLQARDFLTNAFAYDTLKRTLRSGEVRIENVGEQFGAIPSATLRPQPIPVNAKIVLVGNPQIVRLLQSADEDFQRYFKVVADFDTVMERSDENMTKYAAFVAARSQQKNLRPFHKTAVAELIDYSSRRVEDQEKLSTRFMDISDLITEANYWAGKDGGENVNGEHVAKAIEQRKYRQSLYDDRLKEMIDDGTIHIATTGKASGQVNGLAVYSLGDYTFGKPSRISASVSIGRGQLINIERETQMSGKIHNKGFMILTGYLHGKYAQDAPLSLSASIAFEQTYNEVDGDSASSTELYSLLSSLSELGIDQGIAVTGSVNQVGDVQAIGGAIHKIEGFFDVCKAKGLTGTQGVMIPKDNVKNLMLRQDVRDAVEEGKFHIYAVSSIDEGIEVLTGVPAGERDDDGAYPEGTVHFLVEKRLKELAEKARRFGRSPTTPNNEESDDAKPEPDQPPTDDTPQPS